MVTTACHCHWAQALPRAPFSWAVTAHVRHDVAIGSLLCNMTAHSLQTELSVTRGEVAQRNTELSILQADHEALVRSKTATVNKLEAECAHSQSKLADLLADKAIAQNRIRALEHDKCQLCVQVCNESKLTGAAC